LERIKNKVLSPAISHSEKGAPEMESSHNSVALKQL
jgi:hypothetical protein